MMSAFRKDFFREIRRNAGRFLSIFCIIMLGTAFFAGLRSTGHDMKYSADRFYDENDLMDIRVLSTMGLSEEDLSDLKNVEGVANAVGGKTKDVLLQTDDSLLVVRTIAMTDDLNRAIVTEGRLPADKNECFADIGLFPDEGYRIGDVITFISGDDEELDETLMEDTFTIVGMGYLPYYTDLTRGNGAIGDGQIDGFVLLDPSVYDTDYYTEIYLSVRNADRLLTFSDPYTELTDAVTDKVEALEETAAPRRYESVYREASDAIADAKKEVDDGEKELKDAARKIADGKQEIADAEEEIRDNEKKIADGWKEYRDGKKELEDARKELEDGRRELDDAARAVADGKKELESAKKEYRNGLAEYRKGEDEFNAGVREYNDGVLEYNQGLAQYEEGRAQYEDGLRQYEDGLSQYESGRAQYEEGYLQYEAGLEEYEDGKAQYEAYLADYETGKARYEEGRAQYEEGLRQYEEGEAQYEAGLRQYEEGLAIYEVSQAQYEEGRAQYEAGLAEYEAGSAQYEEMLSFYEAYLAEYEAACEDPEISEEELAEKRAYLDTMAAELDAYGEELATNKAVLDQTGAELDAYGEELAANKAVLDEAGAELDAHAEELAANKSILDATGAELDSAEEELTVGKAALDETEEELSNAEAELILAKSVLDETGVQLESAKKELDSSKELLDETDRTLLMAEAQLVDAGELLDASKLKIDEGAAELDAGWAQLEEGAEKIASGEAELVYAQEEIDRNTVKLQDGQAEIDKNSVKLTDAEKELKEGEEKLRDGICELEENRQKLKDAEDEYNEEYPDAVKKIQDARQEIADGEADLADLEVPEWYVLDRGMMESIIGYDQNADRMNSLGKVFPVIFFLVAALVSLTAMTRMVDEQRVQIGTLKALGYSDLTIAGKYLWYAVLATVGGSVVGISFGEWFLPQLIMRSYGIMYTGMLRYDSPINWNQAFYGLTAAMFCTCAATLAACLNQLRAKPAALMRPEAPAAGQRIFLEYLPFIWKRLNFTQKSTMRNLTRYKKRFIMTVIGIGGCMGLLLVGFGLHDSINEVAKEQYINIFMQEALITMDTSLAESERAELKKEVDDYEGVTGSQMVCRISVDLMNKGKVRNAYLYVPEDPDESRDYVMLRDRLSRREYDFPEEGAVICEKTADMLDLSVGDEVTISRDGKKNVSVKIVEIAENYVLHYLFLSPDAYRALYGEEPEYNCLNVNYEKKSPEEESEFGSFLMDRPASTGVSFTTDLEKSVEDMLSILGNIVLVLIVAAGLLAFVVLYNLSSINIMERRRELATLKVLGFYDNEVAAYIYRENIILTILGAAVGVVFGTILHRFVIVTVEVDLMMFGRNISLISYVISTLITFGFSIIVNFVMYFVLKKVDMIESLKSVE